MEIKICEMKNNLDKKNFKNYRDKYSNRLPDIASALPKISLIEISEK